MEDQNTKPTNIQSPNPVVGKPTPQPITTKSTKEKWSLKKLLAVIGGSIVIFIIALIAIVTVSTSAPVKVSDDLISKIQSNDGSGAYSLMSDDAKATIGLDDFKAIVEQKSPILNGKPEIQSREISTNTNGVNIAKVVYKIKGSDNATYNFTVNLIEVNKEWKVLNFESKQQ